MATSTIITELILIYRMGSNMPTNIFIDMAQRGKEISTGHSSSNSQRIKMAQL